MARRVVYSAPTGETFTFDDDWNEADGRVRQIEYQLEPDKPVPEHRHLSAAQTFKVLSGTLHVKVNGVVSVLQAGSEARAGPGDAHSQWNEGPEPVKALETYDPPLAIEPFFSVLPHAIASGNPLKIAVFLGDFQAASANATFGQAMFVAVFGTLGRMFGFGRWYAEYLPNT